MANCYCTLGRFDRSIRLFYGLDQSLKAGEKIKFTLPLSEVQVVGVLNRSFKSV